MSRKRVDRSESEADMPGQDSFLDIIANIVGILIILVVAVGVRASHAPDSDLPTAALSQTNTDEIEAKRKYAVSVLADVSRLHEQTQSMATSALLHRQSRDQLSTMLAVAEAELAARRAGLDDETRRDFDLRSSLDASHVELDRLTRSRLAVERTAAETVQIDSLPTPISTQVAGEEGHFQLRSGRIASVPIERLMRRAQAEERQKMLTLQNQSTLTNTVGPVDGFRLNYRLRQFEGSDGSPSGAGQSSSHGWVHIFYVLPVSDKLGETLGQALAPNSGFRQALKSLNPRKTTITLWTYPESFGEFRSLKKELYSLGYKVACRPLAPDGRIGLSSRGTPSQAQ